MNYMVCVFGKRRSVLINIKLDANDTVIIENNYSIFV